VETYSQQEKAAVKEREFREAVAKAEQQTKLTESDILISIKKNEGMAEYQRSIQEAEKIKALAQAEAEREARVGVARAIAVEEQVHAYGGPSYQVLQHVMDRFSEAVERSGVEIVPRMLMTSGEGGQGNSAFEALIAMLMSEKLGISDWNSSEGRDHQDSQRRQRIRKIRDRIMDDMEQHRGTAETPSKEASDPDRSGTRDHGGMVRDETGTPEGKGNENPNLDLEEFDLESVEWDDPSSTGIVEPVKGRSTEGEDILVPDTSMTDESSMGSAESDMADDVVPGDPSSIESKLFDLRKRSRELIPVEGEW